MLVLLLILFFRLSNTGHWKTFGFLNFSFFLNAANFVDMQDANHRANKTALSPWWFNRYGPRRLMGLNAWPTESGTITLLE